MRAAGLTTFAAFLILGQTLLPAHSAPSGPKTAGEAIYRQGQLPSGVSLVGQRPGGGQVEGADAACANCHRRSGLGETEGRNIVPPIAGGFLFQSDAAQAGNLPFVEGARRAAHEPYSDSTLARAIRDGIAEDGHKLSYLMPRFTLDDASMSALIGYLKQLGPQDAPGVSDTVLHFATIITPDADPQKRQGMLDVLQNYFAEKNYVTRGVNPRLRSSRKVDFLVSRRWELHVWQLQGAPSTWKSQLRQDLAKDPVFAVISGLGGAHWEPVHQFCEEQSLPCLFPNLDAPVVSEQDFYSVYFDKGVRLESQLIAQDLSDHSAEAAPAARRRIVQVYRAGDSGSVGAAALGAALTGGDTEFIERPLSQHPDQRDIERALGGLRASDVLVLWLPAADLARLPAPPPVTSVYVSGELAGLDSVPLPAQWRSVARMTYPVDLPQRRSVRLDYPLGWFRIRQIPLIDPKVQADTYLACGLLAETLSHMTDTFERDYLLERLEDDLDHRIITGYYPRLTLAPGQRFASKGGYIVRLGGAPGSPIEPISGWMTP